MSAFHKKKQKQLLLHSQITKMTTETTKSSHKSHDYIKNNKQSTKGSGALLL